MDNTSSPDHIPKINEYTINTCTHVVTGMSRAYNLGWRILLYMNKAEFICYVYFENRLNGGQRLSKCEMYIYTMQTLQYMHD